MKARGRPAPAAGMLALWLVLCSCGGAEDDQAPAADLLEQLDGRAFVATELEGEQSIAPGSTIRLEFSGDDLEVNAGCNHLSGQAATEGDVLSVSTLQGTEMGCSPRLMAQDSWVAAFLTGRPRVSLTGESLVLTSRAGTLRLEELDVEERPLEGTSWRLESLVEGAGADGAVSSLPPTAADAMMRIQDGELMLTYACTTVSAPVRVDGATVTAGEVAIGVRDCAPRLPWLERHVRAVLDGPTSYVVTGRHLMLSGPDGERGLGFVAEGQSG
jgi:heat shock protein HslJ